MEIAPDETRDILKKLYQYLVPKQIRHDLGEFYTPDWLAERCLNQLNYNGEPALRILDPACGSGTFLILAIKRAKQYAKKKDIEEAETLKNIQFNIQGFDLNPLAVILLVPIIYLRLRIY
jgi:type I restriction-modification system DNA methylase subunit